MKDITELLDFIAQNNQIKGANNEKIKHLQAFYKHKLPSAYSEFLSRMGEYADFLEGESCFIDNLPIYPLGTNNIFKRNNLDFELTESQFVFSSLQGTACWFFNLNEGDNPPVYFFMEGVGLKHPQKVADSFSEYLLKKLNQDSSLFSTIPKNTPKELDKETEPIDNDLPF